MQLRHHLLICDSLPFGIQITAILSKKPYECHSCILLVYISHFLYNPKVVKNQGNSFFPLYITANLHFYYNSVFSEYCFSKFGLLLSNSVFPCCITPNWFENMETFVSHSIFLFSCVRITSTWFTFVRIDGSKNKNAQINKQKELPEKQMTDFVPPEQ